MCATPPRDAQAWIHAAALALLFGVAPGQTSAVAVPASAETDPVPSGGDAADDPALWIHPDDPARSRVLGTDKDAGLAVYDLSGRELQFLPDGLLNNVDVRYGFVLGGQRVDLAAASDEAPRIHVYAIDPATGLLRSVAGEGSLVPGIVAYGLCLYRSRYDDAVYVFVTAKSGWVEQWKLLDAGGAVDGVLVRSFDVGGQTEGCVADDATGLLYVAEEAAGIWRYGAEPLDGTARVQVDSTGPGGNLSADVEGLALYAAGDGTGYLLASSQGSNDFTVYRREGDNAWLGRFSVDGGVVDGVAGTDGIEVGSAALGPAFPSGLFVAQDNDNPGAHQNFKLVRWDAIAAAFEPPLRVDATGDPRAEIPACADGVDNDRDGGLDFPGDPACLHPLLDREDPACDDALDNDADLGVDWKGLDANGDGDLADPGDAPPDRECEKRPWLWKEDGGRCGLGYELAPLAALLRAGRRARSGRRTARPWAVPMSKQASS
jgi:3-phytase